jgi:outer membrane protein assembly factor BamE (lipoprotein component of BamABCDE complex)
MKLAPHLLSLLALSLLVLPACQPGKRLTKANVDQVAEGMAKKQVESILGMPTRVDAKDFVVPKRTTYVYLQGADTVTITFKDDKVESKETTLTN